MLNVRSYFVRHIFTAVCKTLQVIAWTLLNRGNRWNKTISNLVQPLKEFSNCLKIIQRPWRCWIWKIFKSAINLWN